MGTDIAIHIEYLRHKRGKKPYWVHPGEEIIGDRLYYVFGILAGVRCNTEPLYHPRGMPGNATLKTYNDYKSFGEGLYATSWLTTQEFRECLETIDKIAKEEDGECYNENWLKNYWEIYNYMKDSEDAGEPARIVFWFDN